MKSLKRQDAIQLEAAEGWLELGNHREANGELERIAPQHQVHPDVLDLRWKIYATAKKWDACLRLQKPWRAKLPEARHPGCGLPPHFTCWSKRKMRARPF